jgi:hypothetical protein
MCSGVRVFGKGGAKRKSPRMAVQVFREYDTQFLPHRLSLFLKNFALNSLQKQEKEFAHSAIMKPCVMNTSMLQKGPFSNARFHNIKFLSSSS